MRETLGIEGSTGYSGKHWGLREALGIEGNTEDRAKHWGLREALGMEALGHRTLETDKVVMH